MAKIKTVLSEMLGIDYPIIGAPMFLVSFEELVIAVSEAGGLGTFPLPNYLTIDELKQAFKTITSSTDRPIGVNIQLHGRFPWREQLAVCLDAGVKYFTTALGDPRLILADVHANGGKVLTNVVSLDQAQKACDSGADALVAVGAGAGGHAGTISTLVLVPYLVEKVGLPVVAAGGISTGAQMAAALAVGACGVVVGTRLIATPEARAESAYKSMVIEAGPGDIVYSNRVTGNYANWLKASMENLEETEGYTSSRWVKVWSAGQSVAQANSIMPAGQVIAEIAAEFAQVCNLFRGFQGE